MTRRLRTSVLLATVLAAGLLAGASPALGYMDLATGVWYNDIWEEGAGWVAAYQATGLWFTWWCDVNPSYDGCVYGYWASVEGYLRTDWDIVVFDYSSGYNYPAGTFMWADVPPGEHCFQSEATNHYVEWEYAPWGVPDYDWDLAWGSSYQWLCTIGPAVEPSITSLFPSEAGQGESGYLTIDGEYLSDNPSISVSGSGVSVWPTSWGDTWIGAYYEIEQYADPGDYSVTVTTGGGTSNALSFSVTAAPGGGCGDTHQDDLIAEYEDPQNQQTWVPGCSDVVQPFGSAHFSASELNPSNDYYGFNWTITRSYLLSGLECVRSEAGGLPMPVTSGYRNPASQMRINPNSPNSRHTRGDAADVGETDPQRRQDLKFIYGPSCGACVEPLRYTDTWVHFDWRGACPPEW